MLVPSNTRNLISSVHLVDNDNVPVILQSYDTPGLLVAYRVENEPAYTALSLVAGVIGEYIENSWIEIGSGEYQLCLPAAAIVPGHETKLRITAGGNVPLFDSIQAWLPVDGGRSGHTITIVITADTRAVAGVRVTLLAGDNIVAGGITDSAGELKLQAVPGEYALRIASSPIYTPIPVQQITVNGDKQLHYSLSVIIIPPPLELDMCTVRFSVQNGNIPIRHAKVTAKLLGANNTSEQTLLARCILVAHTDSNGLADLVLVRSKLFTHGGRYRIKVISPTGRLIHNRVVHIPDSATAFAADLVTA